MIVKSAHHDPKPSALLSRQTLRSSSEASAVSLSYRGLIAFDRSVYLSKPVS